MGEKESEATAKQVVRRRCEKRKGACSLSASTWARERSCNVLDLQASFVRSSSLDLGEDTRSTRTLLRPTGFSLTSWTRRRLLA